MGRRPPKLPSRVEASDVGIRLGHDYDAVLTEISDVLTEARRATSRTVNAIMTATYWRIGRRIVELEQGGAARAGYGKAIIRRLALDLTARFGRGFSERNVEQMRTFYRGWPIPQTLSAESFVEAHEGAAADPRFPLPWSHYSRLMSVKNASARQFYEEEALRGGWSVRQLDRQIASQFYERVARSRNKAVVLARGPRSRGDDALTPEQEIKDPFILEFLDLKDEYSETDLEEALIRQIETFLLELGGDFAFVGRQRRLRVGDAWYRVDLLFYQRRLRCLIIIDLKLGKFSHADAGQMHLYLNYARENWTHPDENPPVGLILCAEMDTAVAHYALEGLPNKVLAAEYRTTLPDEKILAEEILQTQRMLSKRQRPTRIPPRRSSD